jgi:hypothetical protein
MEGIPKFYRFISKFFNPYFVVLTFGRIAVFVYSNEYGVSLI